MTTLQERLASLPPEKRAWLAQQLRQQQTTTTNGTTASGLAPVDRNQPIPLSFAQQRLWFLHQLEGTSVAYNIFIGWKIEGVLNVTALAQAVDEMIHRHESLRTTFTANQGEPVQVIHPPGFVTLDLVDLQKIPETEKQATAQRVAAEEIQHYFDLEFGPLFRIKLLQTALETYYLLVTMHHLIADGWSMGVMIQELSELYNAFAQGQPSLLPPLPIQYGDFAHWQRSAFQETGPQGEMLAAQLDYWRAQLAGAPPLLELPADHPRPAVQRYHGAAHRFTVSHRLTAELNALARQSGVTLFMVLQAAFAVLLHRYSNQDDILVGMPIANRNHPDIEPLIGFFANTLVLRTNLSGNPTFRTFLAQVQQRAVEAYQHNELPFERLVEAVQPERELSYSPLFQVAFSWEHSQSNEPDFGGLRVKRLPAAKVGAIFDLTLFMEEIGGCLESEWEYNTDLFEEATIRRMTGHFQTLLENIVADSGQRIKALPLLTEAERHQQLTQWNYTDTAYPAKQCFHHLLEEQVERTPHEIAIVFKQETVTYRKLNQRANQLAHYLIQKGVGAETLVGICLERSSDMLVAILGILKAGGAYVPIDPTYPEARIAFMLEDAQLQIVLTSERVTTKLPTGLTRLCLDSEWQSVANQSLKNPANRVQPNNLAYCIYTSGSTGTPKGALIEHRNLTNYLNWAVQAYEVAAGCGAPVNTSISFDATITSLFTPLLVGKTVFLLPEENELEVLGRLLQSDESFSLIKLTPTHLDILSRLVEHPTSARYFIIGGEALFEHHLTFWRSYASKTQFINEYGPTETVVGCCVYDAKDVVSSGAVPISDERLGAIANTQLYILDGNQEPVPFGVPGEFYIGGAGVGRGYLNRPELTAERFVANPFGAGRLYKTGDRVRRLADGKIEFLGRIDTQVKLRGFRIELGEIESRLAAHEQVQEVVVNLCEMSTDVPQPDTIRHCVRCGLPSNHPEAKLNEDDLCDLCITYETYRTTAEKYFKSIEEFHTLVDEMKRARTGQYDCLMLLSGGKDSTYVLGQLVERGLKVLSFTLDNGYISNESKANIRKVVDALGVDHIVGTTPAMNAVFVESLQQHSNVCQGCFKVIYTLSMNIAREHGINYIVTGLSRGQIFETRLQPMFRNGIFDVEEIDRRILESRKIYHRLNDVVSRQMDVAIFEDDAIFDEIQFVDFYRYSDMELAEMLAFLDQRLPWVRPSDTGRSTNCLINEVGIYIHKKERGYHNYALPYSWDVILGHKERQSAMEELDDDIDESNVHTILKEIGYNQRTHVDQRLVAYYMAKLELNAGELRSYLSASLPEYMIPNLFVRLEAMPLTPNGKLDHHSLPVPDRENTTSMATFVPPTTATERQLADIWAELLRCGQVGVQDDFFELGGHSLLATQVIARVREAFGLDIPLRTLFENPTIAGLVTFIEEIRTIHKLRAHPDIIEGYQEEERKEIVL